MKNTSKETSKKKRATSAKKTTQNGREMVADRKVCAWMKQPDESATEYMRFCNYRDMQYEVEKDRGDVVGMVGKRSLRKLCQLHAGETGYSETAIMLLSRKRRWSERCEAYDAYISDELASRQVKSVLEMNERQRKLGVRMIERALSRLEDMPPEEIRAGDLVRLADIGVKIERLARGESTENQRITGEIEEKKTVTVSVEDELKELSVSVLRKMADEYKAKPVEELPTEKILELLREEGEKRP